MTDDFLLTGDAATNPLARELVEYADQIATAATRARQLFLHDVTMVALVEEEKDGLLQATDAAQEAARDLRLIASAVQDRADGRRPGGGRIGTSE